MSKAAERGGNITYRVLSQDFYATKLHGDTIGIMQDEKWRAKSRQFTTDSEIIGKIEEAVLQKDKQQLPTANKVGFIVVRNLTWEDEKDELERRLVIKLFTDSGTWLASGEEMVAEEYALSAACETPLITLAVLTKESEIVTYIRQVRRGPMATEGFAFYLPGPDGKFEAFTIEGQRGAVGDDYKVTLASGDVVVARIDSRVADIGGRVVVSVNDSILAENELFCRVLQCFSVMLRYRQAILNKIQKGVNDWAKGKVQPVQHRHELSLLANPRRLTLNKDEFEEV